MAKEIEKKYKGVVLCGGTGSRLGLATKVINKHLIPIFDRPMCFYPIETLRSAGITNILLITGGNNLGAFMDLLGDGSSLGVDLTYKIQTSPDGIAGALKLARDFVGCDSFTIILGDNIFDDDITKFPNLKSNMQGFHYEIYKVEYPHCLIYLKKVQDPERFGVAVLDKKHGRVMDIVEKPKEFISDYVVVGLYQYHPYIFDMLDELQESTRGEFEISDLNKKLLASNKLHCTLLEDNIYWSDAGTFDTLLQCSNYMANKRNAVA